MRSRSVTGRRSEIAVVDGLRFGKRTRSALVQSIKLLESCISQKRRSSASLRNFGIDLSFLFVA